ncbi:MAG: hydroxymethylglutaryl-CoA lyase [Pseudomonadota bacterium]
MAAFPKRIRVVEVGPRDGLQSESTLIRTADKIAFIDMLSGAGLRTIEVTAFVHPERVPQMADAPEVSQGIRRRSGTSYMALVPNLRGFQRALASSLSEVAVVAAASDTFSRRNINQTIEASLIGYTTVFEEAQAAEIRVRAYVSTAFGCPYEGSVDPGNVAALATRLVDMGAYEVSLCDTIGVAQPGQVASVLQMVLERVPREMVALHFHDTRGTALANTLMLLSVGIATFDAAAAGLGGCPFAPGASGNLATEELVFMLNGLGIETGIDLPALVEAARFIESRIGRPASSRYLAAAKTGGGERQECQ